MAAFLSERLAFDRIADVSEQTLEDIGTSEVRGFDDLFAIDEAARERAEEVIGGLVSR